MDIVSRLKEFINYLAIPVTQFADTCKIPRPSLSQAPERTQQESER